MAPFPRMERHFASLDHPQFLFRRPESRRTQLRWLAPESCLRPRACRQGVSQWRDPSRLSLPEGRRPRRCIPVDREHSSYTRCRLFVDHNVPHGFSPACLRILFNVPGFASCEGCPAMVTRPCLMGWLDRMLEVPMAPLLRYQTPAVLFDHLQESRNFIMKWDDHLPPRRPDAHLIDPQRPAHAVIKLRRRTSTTRCAFNVDAL
jgi:hypothetical protein